MTSQMNVAVNKCVMCYFACLRISACVCVCIGVHVCVYFQIYPILLLQSPSVSNTIQYLRLTYTIITALHFTHVQCYIYVCTGLLVQSDDVEVLTSSDSELLTT